MMLLDVAMSAARCKWFARGLTGEFYASQKIEILKINITISLIIAAKKHVEQTATGTPDNLRRAGRFGGPRGFFAGDRRPKN